MVKGIQIIGIIVGVYLIFQTYSNYKKGNLRLRKASVHFVMWVAMIALFSNPSFAQYILPIFTTQDMIMTVQVTSILVLFIMITNIQQQLSENKRVLSHLVQNLALDDYYKMNEKED